MTYPPIYSLIIGFYTVGSNAEEVKRLMRQASYAVRE